MKKFALCVAGLITAAALSGCTASAADESSSDEPENLPTNNAVTDDNIFNKLVSDVDAILFSINPASSHLTIIDGDDIPKVFNYLNKVDYVAVTFEESITGQDSLLDCMVMVAGGQYICIFASGNVRITVDDDLYYKSVDPIDYDSFAATMHEIINPWY